MRIFFNNLQLSRALPMLAILVALMMPALSAQISTPENSTASNQTGMKNITIGITAEGMSFNTSTITVPAGSHVTVNFDNKDARTRHNFAVYDSSMNPIFRGGLVAGPKEIVYTFDAPKEPGTYRFQCDPHASFMNGQFIVQ